MKKRPLLIKIKKRPLLIRFIEANNQDHIVQCTMDSRHLLNPNTLSTYFELIDVNLFGLYTDTQYASKIYERIISYKCTSYKVIILLHGKDDMFGSDFENKTIAAYSVINFLKALNKPIEILNLACYVRLGKYINELPRESSIIDVGNGQLVNYRTMIHDLYAYKELHEFIYANGIDFYKLLALYTLFNASITNDKPGISTMNCNYDIDKDIEEIQRGENKEHATYVVNNKFFQQLFEFGIIPDKMCECIRESMEHNIGSFSYTFAQFLIDMQEVNFPNNIISKYGQYFITKQEFDTKLVKINKETYNAYLNSKIKYINPFVLLYDCEYKEDGTKYADDFYESIYKYTPLYSYQKFFVIVLRYIK